jgi:hypothetical protein
MEAAFDHEMPPSAYYIQISREEGDSASSADRYTQFGFATTLYSLNMYFACIIGYHIRALCKSRPRELR